MASCAHEEFELSQKHEDILGKRALLLQQMEAHYEQQKAQKKQQCVKSQAAKERNAQILKDFQDAEKNLQTRQLLHPDIINLEMMPTASFPDKLCAHRSHHNSLKRGSYKTLYWASIERELPAWEQYLLGKGKPPVSESGRLLRQQRQKTRQQDPSPVQCRGKPPRPKPR